MKRFLSIALTLIMLATSMFLVEATQSRAENYSTDFTLTGNGATDIVNVAVAQLGKTQSNLGYTEAWCADFVGDCAKLAGVSSVVPLNGGVSYLKDAIINAGGAVVSNRQAGDIVFYYCNSCGGWVHVGIVIDGTNSIEGNVRSQVYKVSENDYYIDENNHSVKSGVVTRTYVRPNYRVITEAPTWANISINKSGYALNENISFSVSSDYATNYTIGINKFNPDTETRSRIYTGSTGTSFSYSVGEAGIYEAYYTAYNNIGYVDSNRVYFSVGILPENVKLSIDKENYETNEIIYFTAECDWGDGGYCIGISRYNTETDAYIRVLTKDIGENFEYSLSEAGLYKAYVTAWNSVGTIDSEKISFTVGYNEIKYNANGGVGAPSNHNKAYGIDMILSSTIPQKDGYTFLGWSTSSTATSAEYSAGDVYTENEDLTLYAVWQKNSVEATYTLTYNANGGSGAPAKQTGAKKYTISSIKPTREGYTFIGWSNSSTATSASYSGGLVVSLNSDLTLYAVWKKNTEVTPPSTESDIKIIISNPSTTVINYGDSIILHADITGTLPDGAYIDWTVSNDNFARAVSKNGETFRITSNKSGKATVTTTVYDADGNPLSADTQEMNSKAGFFQKLISFFKNIFGANRVIEQAFKKFF